MRQLELTEAGAALHGRLLAAALDLQVVVLAGLSADDRAALARCLEVIQANLASAAQSSPPAG